MIKDLHHLPFSFNPFTGSKEGENPWHEMNKFLVHLIVVLSKIDRKKLIVFGAATTTLGLILQVTLLSSPLFECLQCPILAISSTDSILLNTSLHVNLGQVRLYWNHSSYHHQTPNSLPASVAWNNNASTTNETTEEGKKMQASEEEDDKVSKRKKRRGRTKKRRRRNRDEEDELEPEAPLPPPTPPTPLQKHVWSLSPNEALVYAKRELQNTLVVANDSDLYAPIFKNVSMFIRSYELMELILKVYIYPDGKRPIFHEPVLSGIYASEGWFMKQMESNKQFVTNDPEKAHLFYLPYSARQLQQALYVEGSHNLAPLSHFLRDYVDALAAKYPFWNRTRGSDHFLVACHDWGPYTLKSHKELAKNTIKALCNADLSEGVFKAEKDVSLPETTIRRPRSPHRNIGGGKRVSQRSILAFFAGNLHGRVRPVLLKHWHNKEDDMRIYGPLPHNVASKMSYIDHMKSSKFCLCPMGYEVNSPRIVEAIYYECVPVIIADNFVPPFDDVLDWSSFSVIVPEKDIPRLKEILQGIPLKRYLKMLANLKMLQRHFLWNLRPVKYDMFHMILHSIWVSRLNQVQIPN